jgi:hypothetical protein
MALIFGNGRLDLGQFPHLLPQRVEIGAMVVAAKALAVATAGRRLEHHDVVALLGRNQRPFVLGMAGLSAAVALRIRLDRRRLGVRMLSVFGLLRRAWQCVAIAATVLRPTGVRPDRIAAFLYAREGLDEFNVRSRGNLHSTGNGPSRIAKRLVKISGIENPGVIGRRDRSA